MDLVRQSPFTDALGWSLIDSLWQMGLVWLMYVIATANGVKFSASKRHSLAFIAATSGIVWFFASVIFNYTNAINNEPLYSLAWLIDKRGASFIFDFFIPGNIPPILSYVYAPVVVFYLLRVFYQLYTSSFYKAGFHHADGSLVKSMHHLKSRLKITKHVSLGLSDKIESPLTTGFWRPVIILPFAAIAQLSSAQVEAIISHELTHVKRNDFLLNLVLRFFEAIMFFNPFAHLLFAIIKTERENRCDDQVIALGFDSWEYSHALFVLGRYDHSFHQLSVAATGAGKHFLLQRVRRIIKRNSPSPSILKPVIAFFLCLAGAIFVAKQPQEIAKGDAASILKPAVYYYEERQVFVTRDIDKPVKTRSKKVSKVTTKVKVTVSRREEIPPERNEEPVDEIGVVTTYVAAPEVVEYSMIDPAPPIIPDRVICETPQPYIPKASFYYAEIDTTAGKRVIEL